MKHPLHHYFFSHKGNGHKPRLLSEASVIVFAVVIVAVFGFLAFEKTLIGTNTNLAAVYSDNLVTLANQDRAAADLPALTVSPLLQAAAEAKAADMVSKGYFAHYSPTGVSPWYWITEAGYNFVYAGENLAINFTDSDAVNSAWLASPEHRANILNVHYTQIGIATAEGEYEGKETTFVVQMFGTPVAVAPAVSESVSPPVSRPLPKVEPIPGSNPASGAVPIAVQNVSAPIASPVASSPLAGVLGAATDTIQNQSQNQGAPEGSKVTTSFEQTASNPGTLAGFIYFVLALIVLIPLVSIVIAGIRAHNIKHLAYGVGLLALIAVLFIVSTHTAASVIIL